MGDFAFAVEHVDRHEDRAQAKARQEQVDELEAVGQVRGHAIARTDALLGEHLRHPPRPLVDLAERQRAVPAPARPVEGGRFRSSHEGQIEQVAQEHAGILAARRCRDIRPRQPLVSKTWAIVFDRGQSGAGAKFADPLGYSGGSADHPSRRAACACGEHRPRRRRHGGHDGSGLVAGGTGNGALQADDWCWHGGRFASSSSRRSVMKVVVMGGAVSCDSSACRSRHIQRLATSSHDIRHHGRAISSTGWGVPNEFSL